ncbi:trichohyalin-like isoform X2 [Littorina saxatilis]|uniref:trichohyalin-like isoform X2 n=1 Tax=Littorina saxatilis TaxID=31220 RepID=UPI0038B4DD16
MSTKRLTAAKTHRPNSSHGHKMSASKQDSEHKGLQTNGAPFSQNQKGETMNTHRSSDSSSLERREKHIDFTEKEREMTVNEKDDDTPKTQSKSTINKNSRDTPETQSKSTIFDDSGGKPKTQRKTTIHRNVGNSKESNRNSQENRRNFSAKTRDAKYTRTKEKRSKEEEPHTPLSETCKAEFHEKQKTTTFQEGDEESLQMFLSTDFMEREEEYQTEMKEKEKGEKIVFNRQYSETTKRHHEEVIRKILEDFDLETTKDKYRNSNACEIRRNGRSLADFRFRSELLRMMGTDVIRLSDQTWTARFQDCLREDYERQLEEQMYTLAEAENQRMHRLRLEGVIQEATNSASDDMWKRAFESKGPSRAQSRRCSAVIKPKLTDDEARAYPYQAALRAFPSDAALIFAEDEYNRRERELTARRTKKSYRPHRRMSAVLAPKEPEPIQLDEVDSQESVPVQDSDSEIYLPVLSAEERRDKRCKRLPRHVARLYDEETVHGLYNWASRLVGQPTHETREEEAAQKVTF